MDISQNTLDLLFEAFNDLLQGIESREFIPIDCEALPTCGTNTGLVGVCKFGDEFIGSVTTLRALYRKRGFIIPSSLDERHN